MIFEMSMKFVSVGRSETAENKNKQYLKSSYDIGQFKTIATPLKFLKDLHFE